MATPGNITKRDIEEICKILVDKELMDFFRLQEREILIMQMVWQENLSFEQIAPKFNVTAGTVKYIYEKTYNRILRRFFYSARHFKESAKLEAENTELRKSIDFLTARINRLEPKDRETISALKDKVFNPDYKIKLVELDLSTRSLNCLCAANIETLADLLRYSKPELLKLKKLGKKSLTEIEDQLDIKYGLKLAEK